MCLNVEGHPLEEQVGEAVDLALADGEVEAEVQQVQGVLHQEVAQVAGQLKAIVFKKTIKHTTISHKNNTKNIYFSFTHS